MDAAGRRSCTTARSRGPWKTYSTSASTQLRLLCLADPGSSTRTAAWACRLAAAGAGCSASDQLPPPLLPLPLGLGAAAGCSRWALVRMCPASLTITPVAQLPAAATATTAGNAAAAALADAPLRMLAAGSLQVQLLASSWLAAPIAASATAAMGATAANSTCAAGALSGGSSIPTTRCCRRCCCCCTAAAPGTPSNTGPPSMPALQRMSDSSSACLALLPAGTAAETTPLARKPLKCCGARAPKGAPTAVTGCPSCSGAPPPSQSLSHGQGRAWRRSTAAPSAVAGSSAAMWLAAASMSGPRGCCCHCCAGCGCGCCEPSAAVPAWRCSSQPSCQPPGPTMDGAARSASSARRTSGISAMVRSLSSMSPAALAVLSPFPPLAPLQLLSCEAAMAPRRAPGARSACVAPARLPCRLCNISSG